MSEAVEFFEDLPNDGLLREEMQILDALEQLAVTMKVLFPHGVGIKEWAERRVPSEALDFVNASGLLKVSADRRDAPPYVESRGAAPPVKAIDPCEKFLENLPKSKFTPQEEELYSSLVALLRRNGQSSVSSTERDDRTREACDALLPQVVTLDTWVRRRLKGKIEVFSLDIASPWTKNRTEPWLKLQPGAGFDLQHSLTNPGLPNNHFNDGHSPHKSLSSNLREVHDAPRMARKGFVEYNRLQKPVDWRIRN